MSESNLFESFQAAVITVSDTRTADTDLSGPVLLDGLAALGFKNVKHRIVIDDAPRISAALRDMASDCALILTTGGTGFTPRDVTPEATLAVLDRAAPNISELVRAKGLEKTPFAALSRGAAGTIGTCMVINFPGSPKGAGEGLEAVSQLLYPILVQLQTGHCPA